MPLIALLLRGKCGRFQKTYFVGLGHVVWLILTANHHLNIVVPLVEDRLHSARQIEAYGVTVAGFRFRDERNCSDDKQLLHLFPGRVQCTPVKVGLKSFC